MGVTIINDQPVNGHASTPPQRVPTPEPKPTTLLVITSHNYGRFLGECLRTAKAQTVPFTRIVVVDDASTDGTAAIARAHGVEYVRGEWRDVAQARNAGVIGERTRFLLFFDGDDKMPKDYHEKLLAGFTSPKIGVTYAHQDYITEDGQPLHRSSAIIPFDPVALRQKNFAGTPSLMRREAFDQVGGWWGERKGYEDWVMWLRVVAAGWEMHRCEVAMEYRRHAQQMSKATHGRHGFEVRVIEHCTQTCIVTLFGGRDLTDYFTWFDALHGEWEHENLHLVAIDNSGDDDFGFILQKALMKRRISFTYKQVLDQTAAGEGVSAAELSNSVPLRRAHAEPMTQHLIRLYQTARNLVPAGAGFVWSVEDDVTPPPDALRHLHQHLLDHPKRGMVAAMVPHRFADGYIALNGPSMAAAHRVAAPTDQPVLSTTWGCTLFRRHVWDLPALRGAWNWHGAGTAFDYAFTEDLRASGWDIGLADVHCQHGPRKPDASAVPRG
jgi:hypothetical protein